MAGPSGMGRAVFISLRPPLRSSAHMAIGLQRILALTAAAAVLLMSIDCACARSQGADANEPSLAAGASAMPCCALGGGRMHRCRHSHDGASHPIHQPCGGTCEHCGQMVLNDWVAPPAHPLAPAPHLAPTLVAECTSAPRDIETLPGSARLFAADLPPTVTSPTLFSLRCALID